jgi:Holliday junction resolvase RusA-like endonuclease
MARGESQGDGRMKVKIEFFVECNPPKITSQQRRHGYKQAKLKQAEAFWKAVMEINAPAKPLKGALRLVIDVTYPHTKQSKIICERTGRMAIPKLTTPDFDNISKIPVDAMAKCDYFENDSRIFDGRIRKWHGDVPGVAVCLWTDVEWNEIIKLK